MRTGLCTIVMLCVFFRIGFADEIVFTNGERLIGTFKQVEKNKLTFLSEMAGEITVDLDKVRSITTETPMAINLIDGAVLKSNRLERDAESFNTHRQSEDFAFDALSAINLTPHNTITSALLSAAFLARPRESAT